MNFLSGLLVSIAAFFGLQTPVDTPVTEQAPEVQEAAVSQEAIASDVAQSPDTTADAVIDAQMAQKQSTPEPAVATANVQTMLVAGGCFWCVESDLEKLDGVIEVVSGYAGGSLPDPTYQTYKSGGHREVAEVTYDANKISAEDILIVTLKTTDPTDDDGTFADRGDGYSAAFYYENASDKKTIDDLIEEVDTFGPYDKPLAIDVEERPKFWPAEDYHQDYYKGTLSQVKYKYYRNASGRNDFIEKYWGDDGYTANLEWRNQTSNNTKTYMWSNYQKPSKETLKDSLDAIAYKVTQEEGTERAGTSPLDKNWEDGIYVDILSGEPLYSSKDKFDSGTGWPSFVKPITGDALTEKEDRKLFSVRTEIRSAIADNHIGHVFNDGPADRGGLRYCMNGVALKFVPKAEMEEKGYGDFIKYL